ncbi:MAG: type II secretion system protein M [Hyphomonas sp.]|nr:type II secretion system protein M [Hyphomonas sp.]
MSVLSGLSPRERLLVLVAIAIAAICALWLFVVPALGGAHEAARTRLDMAVAANERAIRSGGAPGMSATAPAARAAMSPASERQAMIDAAANRGLPISRLQAPDERRILFLYESVPSQTLYAWLADVEQLTGNEPVRASLDTSERGGVRASIEFRLGAGQ